MFRIFFVFQTNNFSSDIAYFNIRHTKYIAENYFPLIYDEFSYGGKDVLYPPLFNYLLAFFGSVLGFELALKLIPEFLISLLVIIVFLISKQISKSETAALASALLSGFIPLLIRETVNKISAYSLLLPLMFYMFYCYIRLHEHKKYVIQFVILSFLLPLVDPNSFIFLLTLVFFSVILTTESIQVSMIRKEATFFAVFLGLLINFIIYKKAFLQHGFGIVKESIPLPIFELLFRNISVIALVYFIGIVTLVLGVIGLYYGLFKERRVSVLLVSSLMLSVMFVVTIKFIDFPTGLIFIGVALSILSSLTIKRFFTYLQLTKFNNLKNIFYFLLVLLIILFSIIPSINVANDNIKNVFSNDEIKALEWLKTRSSKDSVVLSRFDEGYLISSIAQRKNVMDNNFLLSDDVEERFNDVEILYTNPFKARVLELIRKYGINYIYLSEKTREYYGIKELVYTEDKTCFDLVYENEKAKIYKVIC